MKIKNLINKIFGSFKNDKRIDAIEKATEETIKKRFDNQEKINIQDRNYIEGKMSFNEFLENKRVNGGYETIINPKIDSKIIDNLIGLRIFHETNKGIFIAEPFWHAVLDFIDYSGESLPPKGVLNTIKKNISKLVNVVDIISPLNNRKNLADEIGLLVGQENSLIYSNTPSIFNPFENEDYFKNYTKNFSNSISKTGKSIYYVWNENAVTNQVAENIKSWSKSQNELIQKYYEWFKIFATNHNIKIFWGDNTKFTKSDFSLPYISNSQMIIGLRENSKLKGGVRINMQSVKGVLSMVPTAKRFTSLPPEISNPILGFPSFSNLRKSLIDNFEFDSFSGASEIEIIRFIEYWFAKAEQLKNNTH